ncbi:MAG: hypothetical protein J5379_04475 [Clostridiales bacterium]|nr:hypothetical protein [Clostridiales bacterium]
MTGFKITNLITDIFMFIYSFVFCGLVGGFSLFELFIGSWGRENKAVSEALILLVSSGMIIIHGFLALVFGIIAYSAWRKKAKPYLICNLIITISGILGMGGACLLYSLNATGGADVTLLNNLVRGEVFFLIYVGICVLGLVLTLLSHLTGKETA